MLLTDRGINCLFYDLYTHNICPFFFWWSFGIFLFCRAICQQDYFCARTVSCIIFPFALGFAGYVHEGIYNCKSLVFKDPFHKSYVWIFSRSNLEHFKVIYTLLLKDFLTVWQFIFSHGIHPGIFFSTHFQCHHRYAGVTPDLQFYFS